MTKTLKKVIIIRTVRASSEFITQNLLDAKFNRINGSTDLQEIKSINISFRQYSPTLIEGRLVVTAIKDREQNKIQSRRYKLSGIGGM